MKHVLVTTDFSELADCAIEPAADLARRLNSKLTLAHVIGSTQPPKADPNAAYFEAAKRLYESDQDYVKGCHAKLQERADKLAGVDVSVAIGRGQPVEAVLGLAKEREVDMIVTCSSGRTGLSRILLGSVAEELARKSPVPVLIWKQPE